MILLKSIVAVILLYCVLAVLAIPHKGHRNHGRRHRHSDAHQKSLHVSQPHHKSHAGHHSSKHRTATGALRENVPSPLQDFVLVSGSPLFHERPRARDNRKLLNATEATAQDVKDLKVPPEPQGKGTAANVNQTVSKLQGQGPLVSQTVDASQTPNQEGSQPTDLSKTATTTTSGPVSEQAQENGTAQQQALKHPKEFAKAGLSTGEDQEKVINSTSTNAPILQQTLKGPDNSSKEIDIGLTPPEKTSANAIDQNMITSGANISMNPIAKNEKNVDGNKATDASNEMAKIAPKVNQTDTIAAVVTPVAQNPNPGTGNFPFNTPGIRNYGKEKPGNKEAESNKQQTDNQNLGPNCHWKTTTGENGEKITSLSCSGEFKRPINKTVGMENVGKIPLSGDISAIKESSHGSISTTEITGFEKKFHEQSDEEFEEEAMTTTNALRKIHRAFPIILSPELSRQAKAYAEKIANMGSLQHDLDAVRQLDEGENLAMGCKQLGVPLTAKEAITNWYNEVCEYDFDRGEFSMSTGHFTQVVWSDSKEFGIGKAAGQQNGMPCTFVVGRFHPSGNYKGEYKRNVFKGTFDPSYCDNLKEKKII